MLPNWIRVYRMIFGAIGLIGIWYNLEHKPSDHFFSYFTNQSTVLASIVLILGGLVYARQRNPMWWDIVRGCAVISMLVTGIVYAVLLDGIYNPFTTTTYTWAESYMHQALPIIMLLDLLIVPLSSRTPRWTVLFYPLYPLAYLTWFLISGRDTGWYPYDFIDARTYDNGYVGVFTTCGLLLLVFIIIGLALIGYSRIRRYPVTLQLS